MNRLLILALSLTSSCAPLPVRDPYADAIRRENSLMLMQMGAQLMQNSRPRAIVAPPAYAPQNVTCTEFGYGITRCRQW
jgi:hypothetical protein